MCFQTARMIKTVARNLRRVLGPVVVNRGAIIQTVPSQDSLLCFNKTLLKPLNFCSYCTRIHRKKQVDIFRRNAGRKTDEVQIYASYFMKYSQRHYTVDAKSKKIETASKVPLAKAAAVRRQRKRPVEDVEVKTNSIS